MTVVTGVPNPLGLALTTFPLKPFLEKPGYDSGYRHRLLSTVQ